MVVCQGKKQNNSSQTNKNFELDVWSSLKFEEVRPFLDFVEKQGGAVQWSMCLYLGSQGGQM